LIKNKIVLVAGGGGFIGSHLAKKLKEQGNFVRIADLKKSEFMPDDYFDEYLPLDLRRFDNCKVATKAVDVVFHLAANMGGIGFITSVGADVIQQNVLISAHMLEASVRNNVDQFFFSSSACIYPNYKQRISEVEGLREEDAMPADPNEYYGWEKLFTEKMCLSFRKDYGLKTCMARFHNIFGPYGTFEGGKEKAPAALCRKIALAKDGGNLVIWGDGKQTRSFLYVSDCVRGILAIVERDFSDPVNIGSDRLVTIDELADIIIRASGKNLKKVYDTSKPEGVRGRNSNNELARTELKWEPEVSLEEGMGITYHWIESQLARRNL